MSRLRPARMVAAQPPWLCVFIVHWLLATDHRLLLNVARLDAALRKILLVILLSTVELRSRSDLRHDGLGKHRLRLFLRRDRRLLLLRRMEEDRRTILRADVRSLAVKRRGIMHLPECVEQFVVVDARRVERYLHHFGVAGGVSTNVLIGWVLQLAAQVT